MKSDKNIKSSECEQIRSLIRNDLFENDLTFCRDNFTLAGLSVGILSTGVCRICFGTGFRFDWFTPLCSRRPLCFVDSKLISTVMGNLEVGDAWMEQRHQLEEI